MTPAENENPLERRNLVEQINAIPSTKDCLSCRIIGTGALGGTGAYAIWQARRAAPGSMGQKRILAGLGLALLVGSACRWRQ